MGVLALLLAWLFYEFAIPHAWHHVTSRGNRWEASFSRSTQQTKNHENKYDENQKGPFRAHVGAALATNRDHVSVRYPVSVRPIAAGSLPRFGRLGLCARRLC